MFGVYAAFGSVHSGSHRLEDLIPAYHSALDDLRERVTLLGDGSREIVEWVGMTEGYLASVERRMEEEGYYDSEQAQHDLESLEEGLESFAPVYGYFGANEGDGADFGFWFSRESFDEAVEDGTVVKVDELPDEPEDLEDVWYYAQVSDHGNVTLYAWDDAKRKFREVWSIV